MQAQGVKRRMTKKNQTKRPKLPRGVRISWNIIRMLLFPVLCITALFIGLRIGYVQFGGGSPADVTEWDTWKHVFDLVFKDS